MVKALVIGDWLPGGGSYSALEALADGVSTKNPDCYMDVRPCGSGETFLHAFDPRFMSGYDTATPFYVDEQPETTERLGATILDTVHADADADARRSLYIQGGHLERCDGGIGLLEVLSGQHIPRDRHLVNAAIRALDIARSRLSFLSPVFAVSTSRPLLGLDSVSALSPDLRFRTYQDTEFLGALSSFYQLTSTTITRERRYLPLVDGSHRADDTACSVARQPGSGAGGGMAAMIRLLGGRIFPLGEVLHELMNVDSILQHVDLVITCEPHLPSLADSPLHTVRMRAQKYALPVVAVAHDSMLGRREMAEEGIHGVMTAKQVTQREKEFSGGHPSACPLGGTTRIMNDIGRRIASTWLP